MTSFSNYSDILLDAFKSSNRSHDIAIKKKDILVELIDHYGTDVESILFVGFSPGILELDYDNVFVTEVSDDVVAFIAQERPKVKYLNYDSCLSSRFDVVVAVDEYLTFAQSDEDQRESVKFLCSITNKFIITTLRDYKNQDYKDREFSQPIVLRNSSQRRIYFEHYEYDSLDRNNSSGTCYIVADDSLDVIGPFARRNMFFKQLAKFSLDAGASSFLVHKNLMHKSIVKKNYEHIITIKF